MCKLITSITTSTLLLPNDILIQTFINTHVLHLYIGLTMATIGEVLKEEFLIEFDKRISLNNIKPQDLYGKSIELVISEKDLHRFSPYAVLDVALEHNCMAFFCPICSKKGNLKIRVNGYHCEATESTLKKIQNYSKENLSHQICSDCTFDYKKELAREYILDNLDKGTFNYLSFEKIFGNLDSNK